MQKSKPRKKFDFSDKKGRRPGERVADFWEDGWEAYYRWRADLQKQLRTS